MGTRLLTSEFLKSLIWIHELISRLSVSFLSFLSSHVWPPQQIWLDWASHGANQINSDVSSDGWGASPAYPACNGAALERSSINYHSQSRPKEERSVSVCRTPTQFSGEDLFFFFSQPNESAETSFHLLSVKMFIEPGHWCPNEIQNIWFISTNICQASQQRKKAQGHFGLMEI